MEDKDSGVTIGPVEAKDEVAVSKFLNKEISRWHWKYKEHPGFSPSMLTVAKTQGGDILGTLARFPLQMRIKKGLVIDAVMEHELRVSNEARRKGIARQMIWYDNFNGAILTIGSVTEDLFKRFHSKVGLVKIPDYSSVYTKFLSVKGVTKNLRIELDLSDEISGLEKRSDPSFAIRFVLIGMPSFVIQIHEKGVAIEEQGDFDVTIKADYNELFDLLGSNPLRLLFAILIGGVRVRGSIRNKIRLLFLIPTLRKRLHVFGSFQSED